MNYFASILLVSTSVSLVSCASLGLFKPPKFVNPHEQKSELLDNQLDGGVGDIGIGGGTGSFKANFSQSDIAAIEADTEWADEDVNVPFQENIDVGKEHSKTWTKSFRSAIRRSRAEGKPLLIWFSDSARSAISANLSSELFSRPDFDQWVQKNYVTLLVDKAIEPGASKTRKVRLKRYHEKMTKRFSVHGTPEVLVVNSQGEVQARYRGYRKGDAKHYWGRLKVVAQATKRQHGEWRERLEAKGYRIWHNIEGDKKTFAKMHKKDAQNVVLVTPNGKRFKVPMLQFSKLDREWINAQE